MVMRAEGGERWPLRPNVDNLLGLALDPNNTIGSGMRWVVCVSGSGRFAKENLLTRFEFPELRISNPSRLRRMAWKERDTRLPNTPHPL
jgi:hypothetical protein